METLTADATGVLKKANGDSATWSMVPGKRYAYAFTSNAAAGVITPVQGTELGFVNGVDDSATAEIAWDFSTFTGDSGGFEFVAVDSRFSLPSSGFTEGDTLSVGLVQI